MATKITKCDVCDSTKFIIQHTIPQKMLVKQLQMVQAKCTCGNIFEFVRRTPGVGRGRIL